jgi:hypothetical protein
MTEFEYTAKTDDPVTYEYVAQVGHNKMGNEEKATPLRHAPVQNDKLSIRDKAIQERVLARVKLPNGVWDNLIKDLQNKESKTVICNTYRIKPADLKQIRRWLGY